MIIKFWHPKEENGWLSNFHPSCFERDGKKYHSVEQYYQSKKFSNYLRVEIENNRSSKRCWEIANDPDNLPFKHPNWDMAKHWVMRAGLMSKFSIPEFREKLIATGDAHFEETSPTDYYWGSGLDGTGLNMLGFELENVRMLLK